MSTVGLTDVSLLIRLQPSPVGLCARGANAHTRWSTTDYWAQQLSPPGIRAVEGRLYAGIYQPWAGSCTEPPFDITVLATPTLSPWSTITPARDMSLPDHSQNAKFRSSGFGLSDAKNYIAIKPTGTYKSDTVLRNWH